jgi:hypothetical protein
LIGELEEESRKEGKYVPNNEVYLA